ncbi:dynein family protein [Patellaria atrata CBS 101060]|uniref:Dynein family protein n=1 Tax=Patellaria atrata CBS 101060 TaxID=1346257 RepID=A0A9P4VS82_9PEZI|nr:dynein family protein [Patellaria atrata CBS 101060]
MAGGNDEGKKDIWSSMLEGVSSSKKLPEKSLIVLGGTPETQRDFLESLSIDPISKRRPPDRSRRPPIANSFALGYTYQDVLDADHEDILARLSLYLLSDPSPSFMPLLKPYLNPRSLPNTLVVILLDWGQPWSWVRQLRDWMRVLRSLMISLDDGCKEVLEENITKWRDRGRHGNIDGSSTNNFDSNVTIPLGPGEWDEPLGLPLCVVCQNADKIEILERERGWKEEEFDFVLQYLRTILLKHGSSLVYTMPSAPGSLQTLIHSSLGIQSTLKKQELKYNTIDRDKVLVPPNWDSWAKIRILREGFDFEGVSQSWSIDIQGQHHEQVNGNHVNGEQEEDRPHQQESESEEGSAVAMYEDTIRDPERDSAFSQALTSSTTSRIEIDTTDSQSFLAKQLDVIEQLKSEDDSNAALSKSRKGATSIMHNDIGSGVVEEHIGPVQFNMGGIQVNADDMVQKLKVRSANEVIETPPPAPTGPLGDNKSENEQLAAFFENLMKRTGSTPAAANTPRRPEM